MVAKFVIRLLDADGELLSWATVHATARPQTRAGSCPFLAPGPTPFVIERDGIAGSISVHWCDLDVARRQQILEGQPVSVGQTFAFTWMEPVWIVPGMQGVPLPPVTVRAPVAIGIPTGSVTAVAP